MFLIKKWACRSAFDL